MKSINLFLSIFILTYLTSYGQDSLVGVKRFRFLPGANVGIGLNLNQGEIGGRYFSANFSPSYHVNLEVFKYRFASLFLGMSSFKKAYVGYFPHKSISAGGFGTSTNGMAPGSGPTPSIDFSAHYYSVDFKVNLRAIEKKHFQLFGVIGIRYNILSNYGYQSLEREVLIDEYIVPNLKKTYLNYFYGFGASYKIKKHSGVLLEFQLNGDGGQYFTDWKYGGAVGQNREEQKNYGGKFFHLFSQIGYQYYF
jgi:hypothetical protein